jgi:hypothetical protein
MTINNARAIVAEYLDRLAADWTERRPDDVLADLREQVDGLRMADDGDDVTRLTMAFVQVEHDSVLGRGG